MNAIIEQRLPELEELCRRNRVARLGLFGSAATDQFDPDHSDLDFVLEYLPEAKVLYPDVYFELKAGLEALFGRPVDLVMRSAIRNPYFKEEIDATQVSLYTA